MKIREINFPAGAFSEVRDLGFLSDIKLSRLGNVVILAGPNGSGKSRLLRAISEVSNNRNVQPLAEIRDRLRVIEPAIERAEKMLEGDLPDAERSAHVQNVRSWQAEVEILQYRTQAWQSISTTPENVNLALTPFVARSATLHSPEDQSPAIARNQAAQFSTLGLYEAEVRAPSYIKHILQKGFNAGHSEFYGGGAHGDAISSANELKVMIELVLGAGADPRYTIEGQVSIFGRTDYAKTLSDGQKVLLQMAAALHAQGTNLSEALLVMDEPENHLHPSALVEVISKLQASLTNGQLWIATHSVPLIAHLAYEDPNCLWYMYESVVSYAGRRPELVLKGLLGKDDGIERLNQFTLLPMQLAANRFLAECLRAPGTVGPDAADPQTNQIRKIIERFAAERHPKPLRILDCGAGKGRLLAALQELTRTAATAEGVEIDYIAYDPFDDDKAECLMELRNAYPDGDPSSRYFNDIAEVGVKFDRHSFDVAVMCNVLHEIDPDKWVTELGPQSQIARLLRNDGCLLIVEDYGMPVGEKAHAHGFLLLDEAELTRLFRISENDRRRGFFQVLDARPDVPDQRGRLKAILIPAEMLARVTDATRLTAVEELLENSATKMRRLRIAGSDSKSGQRYALAAQLYANAALWLKDRGPRS